MNKFYAFPTFSLVLRTLRKIITNIVEEIVVVRYWPSQPWFPLFYKLLVSPLLYMEPNINLLSSPFRKTHPLSQTLSVVAGTLSANHFD